MPKTLYLNIEDDVQIVVQKVARLDAAEIVLVVPRRSPIISDLVNARLLKKQTDLLGKTVSIFTMDEVGRLHAQEAGFQITASGAKPKQRTAFSDIRQGASINNLPEVEPAVPEIKNLKKAQLVKVKKPEIEKTTSTTTPPFVLVKETSFPERKDKKEKALVSVGKSKKTLFRVFLAFLLPALVLVLVLVFYILPQAKVVVYVKRDSVVRDLELNAAVSVTEVDPNKMLLPASAVTKTISVADNFTTAGKREVGTKAQGKVQILNLTGKSLNLRAGTTVLSFGNKNYSFTSDQNYIKVVQPKDIQSGKYQATIAEVIAEKGGEGYNVPDGTRIEITNQVFGSQPEALYAKADGPLIGGTSRFISVITDEDVQKAKQALIAKALEQVRQDLLSQELLLPEGSYTVEILEFNTDKTVDTESPNFSGVIKLNIKGLAIDKTKLYSLLENRVVKSIPADQKLVNSVDASLNIKGRGLNLDNGIMSLSAHVEVKSRADVNIEDIPKEILGKNKQEASEIVLAKPQIEKIDMILSPYWQRTMPRVASKIQVEIAP